MREMNAALPASLYSAAAADPAIKAYLAIRRRFDYSALIVALYAAYETFVEELIASYIDVVSQNRAYDDLPQGLQKKHLLKTGELLSRRELDQARHPGITPRKLVDNLYDCLSGATPYLINHSAVLAHDANFRLDELKTILGLAEINLDEIRRDRQFISWYCSDQEIQENWPLIVPETVLKQRLDDLVGRRNSVAHRGGNPDDRLGPDEMHKLIEFVHALSQSIFALFVSGYLRQRYIAEAKSSKLTFVKGPFKEKHVRVVQKPATKLYIGQAAFALSPSGSVRWGRITGLQVDQTALMEVEPGGNQHVGVETDFPAPKVMDVFTLSADDDLVWEPLSGEGQTALSDAKSSLTPFLASHTSPITSPGRTRRAPR